MAVDADGSPILIPVKVLKQVSGESIEPEECRAVLGKQIFEAVYGLYMEWHTVSSTDCPLLELCQAWTVGGMHRVLDGIHGPGTLDDIDAGLGIGHAVLVFHGVPFQE